MPRMRMVDNQDRPAQPEPDEDEAIEKPPSIREEGDPDQERPAPIEEDPTSADDTPLRLSAGRPPTS